MIVTPPLHHLSKTAKNIGRRAFLKSFVLAGGGLALGLPKVTAQPAFDPSTWSGRPSQAFEYWLEIATNNSITVFIHLAEMGQGITTSVAMLVAEELEADWRDIHVQFAPNGEAYYNRGYSGPLESTGGSASIRGAFNHSREIGANAREMLRLAAAKAWGVPVSETRAALSHIHHDNSGRKSTFGALADQAAEMTPPENILLKPKSHWNIVGQPLLRLDAPAKVDGSALFGADVQLEGLLTAAIRHCPAYDGRLTRVDPAPTLSLRGVERVVTFDNAVAVLAQGYWAAHKGLEALDPIWDLGDRTEYDMEALYQDFESAVARPDAPVIREDGDFESALEYADAVYEQTFDAPYLAHVCMEPMNATAWVRDDGVDIWMPGQGHSLVVDDVSVLLNVEKDSI
ncbi:MAG: molybdopterin-dependent oxidoreductase [Alphaproteobacteria bacterium]|nr:molybdopterin-dependent oxidoreductase [Alphaproteobacteria bacterium]